MIESDDLIIIFYELHLKTIILENANHLFGENLVDMTCHQMCDLHSLERTLQINNKICDVFSSLAIGDFH